MTIEREREWWARLGNDYRALIDLENWCKNSFNKVVAIHMSPPQGYGLATWKKKL